MSVELNRKGLEMKEFIKFDPLYEVIKDKTLENQLLSEEYLDTLEEKRWYSTPEVAEWFGINDGQLRYYIKPFHEYLFTEETPSSSTAYRLNIESILKLRMILLLKDEYRVKGLQKLVGLREGYVQKKEDKTSTSDIDIRIDLENQVEALSNMMQQILKTGLFEMKQGEDGPEITLHDKYLSDQVKQITGESETVSEMQKITEDFAKDKEEMQIQFNKARKEDIVIRMKERRIERQVTSELTAEALEKWAGENKHGIFAKLFQADQIEVEKEKSIQAYIQTNLDERLYNAMAKYHEFEVEDI
jgi:DNA-binding transcriptional MerR regulator